MDCGAEALGAAGVANTELVAALKAEERNRIQTASFFGHIAYASVTATKPA